MSSEPDPSIIEYARYYGLACDHQAIQPLQSIFFFKETLSLAPIDNPSDEFEAPLEANTLEKISPSERMFIDADTAKVLVSITQLARRPEYFDEDDGIHTMRCKKLKHELPLLNSDHESDVQDLLRNFEPNLRNEFLPFEILNEDADEGFTWPSNYLNLSNQIWQKLSSEKLELSAQALQYLSGITKGSSLNKSEAIFESNGESRFTDKKKILFKPVTPPLLPMSPEHVPFLPSLETEKLDLLSEPSSPTKEQLRELEQQIFDQDAIKTPRKTSLLGEQSSDPVRPDSDSVGEINSSLNGMRDPPSSPPDDRWSSHNLKVELLLVIAEPGIQLHLELQNASIRESLTGMDLSLPVPITDFREDEIMGEISAFFNEAIKPMAEKTERSIEQEQLQEADTTRRVSVPIMDFSLPQARWNIAINHSHLDPLVCKDTLLQDLKSLHLKDHKWLLCGRVERELQWTPFPAAMGRVDLCDIIHDDGTLGPFLTYPSSVDTDFLSWKPPGLRLFDSNSQNQEENLEEGCFQRETNLQSLVRKRRREMLEDKAVFAEERCQQGKLSSILEWDDSDGSLCVRSLESFIWMREGSTEAKKLCTNQCSPQIPTIRKPAGDSGAFPPQETLFRERMTKGWLGRTTPDLKVSERRFSIILSANVLKNRALVRRIQEWLPNIEIIERNCSIYSQTLLVPQDSKQALSAKALKPAVTEEADILMSPGAGLMLTTLQKIRQEALPGQNPQSLLREDIKCISSKYESLIVMVSVDYQASEPDQFLPMTDLSYSDCEAIALFIAFCSNLEAEAHVVLVAGGNEGISRWVVCTLVKYSASNPGIQLIQDETLWELFLRRLGFNAFAAQAILSELNQKKMRADGHVDFGLTTFVKMSAEERINRFEKMLGGRKLLSKINAVLEERW